MDGAVSFKKDWLEKVEEKKNFECYNVLVDMIYDAGQYIGIFNGGTIYVSSDGEKWTKRFECPKLRGINKCNSYYIGTGLEGYLSVGTSVNTLGATGSGTSSNLYACTVGSPTTYVACGVKGTIVRALDSPGGFSPVLSGVTDDLFDITVGGIPEPVYVAVGANGTCIWARQIDRGLNWSRGNTAAPDETLLAVRWSGGRFVAVGTNGVSIQSVDGKSWFKGGPWGDTKEFLGRRDVRCLDGSFTGICSNGRVVHGSSAGSFSMRVNPDFPYQR